MKVVTIWVKIISIPVKVKLIFILPRCKETVPLCSEHRSSSIQPHLEYADQGKHVETKFRNKKYKILNSWLNYVIILFGHVKYADTGRYCKLLKCNWFSNSSSSSTRLCLEHILCKTYNFVIILDQISDKIAVNFRGHYGQFWPKKNFYVCKFCDVIFSSFGNKGNCYESLCWQRSKVLIGSDLFAFLTDPSQITCESCWC